MIYLYIILGIILALLLFLLFVPIRLHLGYENKNYILQVNIAWITIDLKKFMNKGHKQKKQKPQPKSADEQEKKFVEKINETYKKIVYIKNVYNAGIKTIIKRFITENIEAYISFGMSDAAVTGMVTGAVWALLYELLGLLTIVSTVRNHKFNVDSVYDRFLFEPRFSAAFRITLMGAIIILLRIMYNLKKYKE